MLSSLLFIFTTLAVADDPDFTIVSIGQPAPFEGVLLSAPAAAEVLAEHEAQKLRCELEIEFQVDKTKTECQLNIDLLNTRIESLNTEYTEKGYTGPMSYVAPLLYYRLVVSERGVTPTTELLLARFGSPAFIFALS